jgi:peptidoglycan/LPS O-acetylase OafA/YrhL
MEKISLHNISKYRNVLTGIATIMIIFYHSFKLTFPNNFFGEILLFIKRTSELGVEIFLSLSAMGLYFSLEKDCNIESFYKKRFFRIIPCTIIIAIIYFLFIENNSIFLFLSRISLLSFYTRGERYFWYISFIIVLYLVYPFLHKIIKKYDIKSLIILLFLTYSFNFLIFKINNTYFNLIEIALARIPIFLVSIYIGKLVYNKKEIKSIYLIVPLTLFITANIILYNTSFTYNFIVRYIYGVISLSIIFLLTYMLSKCSIDFINKIIVFFGTYSIEIYLIYEKLGIEILKHIDYNYSYYLYYFIILLITLLLSKILKLICNKIEFLFIQNRLLKIKINDTVHAEKM